MNGSSIQASGTIAVFTLLALGATACGGGAIMTTNSDGAVAGSAVGHVGDTLTDPDRYLASDVATVTLVKVIDPVTPDTASNLPDPGNRWVGLEMTIIDNGANAAVATDIAFVTGSDGKLYSINADIAETFTECTSTMNDLQPNQKATFCPGFLLPIGVAITKVGYSTRTMDASQTPDLTWTVP